MTPWNPERFQAEMSRVSLQRREKTNQYKFPAERQQSLMAYRLLQDMLEEEYGMTEAPIFEFGENGKPVIAGHPGIHFNLSHCKQGVAVAISNAPVGIDIECIPDTLDMDLAEYVLSSKELQQLSESPSPTVLFTEFWVKKEALLKRSGTGLVDSESLRALLEKTDSPFEIHVNLQSRYICAITE